MTLKLDMQYSKANSYAKFQLNMSKHVREKKRKTVYFQYSKVQKGHNSHKNGRKLTKLKLDMQYSKTKSYVKFQRNMSKHVGAKSRKYQEVFEVKS